MNTDKIIENSKIQSSNLEDSKKVSSTSKGENLNNVLTKSSKYLDMPWLDQNGKERPDSEISKLGKSWSTETWNNYLSSSVGEIEDENEVLSFFENMDTDFVLERSLLINAIEERDKYDDFADGLALAISKLSRKEQSVIKASFWRNMSDHSIAKEINSTYAQFKF